MKLTCGAYRSGRDRRASSQITVDTVLGQAGRDARSSLLVLGHYQERPWA
jgi:hypothetical protein